MKTNTIKGCGSKRNANQHCFFIWNTITHFSHFIVYPLSIQVSFLVLSSLSFN